MFATNIKKWIWMNKIVVGILGELSKTLSPSPLYMIIEQQRRRRKKETDDVAPSEKQKEERAPERGGPQDSHLIDKERNRSPSGG